MQNKEDEKLPNDNEEEESSDSECSVPTSLQVHIAASIIKSFLDMVMFQSRIWKNLMHWLEIEKVVWHEKCLQMKITDFWDFLCL